MNDVEPPKWLRGMAVTQTSATLYGALGASCGAVLYLIAPYFNGNSWGWFFVGMAIPPGPLYLAFSSDWMFERRLRRLKLWLDEGLMPARLYEESLERAIAWRDERLFGKPTKMSRTASRKQVVRPLPHVPDELRKNPASGTPGDLPSETK